MQNLGCLSKLGFIVGLIISVVISWLLYILFTDICKTLFISWIQVLALDKRYLDPRRTVNPTQSEKEEGIIPLTDSLPIIPQVIPSSSSTHKIFWYWLINAIIIEA